MNPDLLNDIFRHHFFESMPADASMDEQNTFRKVIQTARGFIIAQKENPTEYSEKQLLSDLEALFFEKQITELIK